MQQLNRKQRRALEKARKKGVPGMHGRIRLETSYRILDSEGRDVTELRCCRAQEERVKVNDAAR